MISSLLRFFLFAKTDFNVFSPFSPNSASLAPCGQSSAGAQPSCLGIWQGHGLCEIMTLTKCLYSMLLSKVRLDLEISSWLTLTSSCIFCSKIIRIVTFGIEYASYILIDEYTGSRTISDLLGILGYIFSIVD